MYINHDSMMTLTDFEQGQHRSHIEKSIKMSLKEKSQEMGKWTEY